MLSLGSMSGIESYLSFASPNHFSLSWTPDTATWNAMLMLIRLDERWVGYKLSCCWFPVIEEWTYRFRDYRQEKAKKLLSNTFRNWLEVVEEDMQSQISSFKEKLILTQDSLQCSLRSSSTLMPPDKTTRSLPLKSTSRGNELLLSDDNLLDLYKDSLESGDTCESGKSPTLGGPKTEQSDFLSTSLPPFSTSGDTNNDDLSYHQELVDYNTDNDIDQDQVRYNSSVPSYEKFRYHSTMAPYRYV